jgi:hypothetical protein
VTLPEPPVNVRVVLRDGTEVPVDTVYQGMHRQQHHWLVVNGPPPEAIFGVRIEALPPRTMVIISNEETEEGNG